MHEVIKSNFKSKVEIKKKKLKMFKAVFIFCLRGNH